MSSTSEGAGGAPVQGSAQAETAPNGLATLGHVFRSTDHRDLQVICALEAVISVRDRVEIATRVTPTVLEVGTNRLVRGRARANLDPTDLWEIDLATLAASKPLLEQAKRPTLTPVSFHTLSRARAREKLFDTAGVDPRLVAQGLVPEIVAVGAGTPETRLDESLFVVRPLFSAVFVETLSASAAKMLMGNGVAGVTIDLRDSPGREETTLFAFGEACGGLVRTVLARGLPSAELLNQAEAAGVTHVSVRAGSQT